MAKRKKLSKSKRSSRLLKFFFILGFALISASFVVRVNASNNLSFAKSVPPSNIEIKKSSPKYILIPSAGIALPVDKTVIVNRNWEISEEGASHLYTSANPGEGGNIIIYAHNTKDRFGKLSEVKKGEFIKLNTADNKFYTYEVENILAVNPDEVSLLMPTDKEILTVYTCTGFADLKRLVIQAYPVSSESLPIQ